MSPLKVACDPQSLPHVRRCLENGNLQAQVSAAQCLAAMKDLKSFERIAEILRATDQRAYNAGDTRTLSAALLKLNPDKARPIVEEVKTRFGK